MVISTLTRPGQTRPRQAEPNHGEPGSRADAASPGQLSDADFTAIADMVRRASGIMLGPTKRELVFGRLGRRLRALGLTDFSRYLALVEGPQGGDEREMMINALTTNLTGFFREMHHFHFLADEVLARLLQPQSGRERRIRIWSAGCSSGEEPYSIAMTLHWALRNQLGCDARILATDIDTDMVATAQAGHYDNERAAQIPPEFQRLYTEPVDAATIAIAAPPKDLIAFKPLNLLGDWPMRGPFDAIFCRNVVIYFDKDVQRRLFSRYADLLVPGGWLFIGHSESLFRVSDRFESLGRTIYRKLR